MIKIRHDSALITIWTELKTNIKNDTIPLNIGDEIDIELKTGERVTLVCELVKDGYATFFTKDLLEDTHSMDEGVDNKV